jgi:ABC-type antimicrobial peptide transport system permease subunit
MFFTYLSRELRRRKKQALVVALGLALGVGLVVAVTAMAGGVKDAQATVLHSLYGVGTDVTVTQKEAPTQGGPPGGFQVGGGNDQPAFSRDQIRNEIGLKAVPASQVDTVAKLDGVRTAAGGLSITSIHLSGKLPTFTAGQAPTSTATPSGGPPSGGATTPGQIRVSTISIDGVDVSNAEVGPMSSTTITDGRGFTTEDSDAKVAVLDRSYARQESLSVGDTVTLGGVDFNVVGVSTGAVGAQTSNAYIPLTRAQALAGEKGKVTTIYVKADSASDIDQVKAGIEQTFPNATVTTASDLASQVTGSLSGASTLITKLGSWLAMAVLIAAVAVATLLMLSSVGRRTREFGTLKAIGWRTRRVVGQVLGESVVIGVVGGALGVIVGIGVAALVAHAAPSLTATVLNVGSGAFPGAASAGPPAGASGSNPFATTVNVALTTPVRTGLAATAFGLSLVGGLIAGGFAGWRAARMRPADAMRQIT